MVVLDASGILNAFGFRFDRVFYTTPSVIDEIRDLRSRSLVEAGIMQGKLIARIPSEKSLERAREKARELGLEGNLSKTDLDVIALALDLKDEIWTDDKAIRKVAKALGLKAEGTIY